MSVKVVLGVRLLRWRPVHVLALPVRRTVAAVRGGPTVSTAVGLAQRQVSAVPLTVAVQSRNQQEAKNQCSTEREEQTRAAGQKQAQPTQEHVKAHLIEAQRLCRSTRNNLNIKQQFIHVLLFRGMTVD